MVGKQADSRDRLKIFVIDGTILGATAFSILAEKPSGPLDLVAGYSSRASIRAVT